MSAAASFVVEMQGLGKQFRNVVAVQDLSLRIPRGGVFGLLGPNGSGKTTTIGMLLGLIRPTSGIIRLFGEDVRKSHESALRRIGAMVESPAFYPELSARANLRYFQGIGEVTGGRSVSELLQLVGLAERADSRFRTYSQGMKQRLGIAHALLGSPELLFLDEPTNGLDPSGMAEIRELIARLAEAGHTIVLSSHLLHEVEQVCDEVAILSRGRLVASGKVRELLLAQDVVQLRTTDDERARRILGSLDWVSSARKDGGYLMVAVSPDRSGDLTRELCHADVFVTEMTPRKRSLESYFLDVTETGRTAGEKRQ